PLKHNEAKKMAPINPAGVFLNWNEIEKMSDICNFHSHTNGHGDAYFDSLKLADDIFTCKKIIKHRLGFDDKHLCWPRGRYSMESIKIAKKLGYEIFYTVERGVEFSDKKLDKVTRIGTKGGAFWLARTLFLYQNSFTRTIYEKLHGKR
ncbi:polysaccharide deacetylase family protein, partial [Campylobacter mucosalis]|uniref:polysaccharide deacetylase family protein n=1 Tax=Campylobacter mucosalis TaxID=202 RepID=UPI001B8BAC32